MTPERRLDQLEPLLAEALAVLDQHTALLEQHTALHRQTQAQIRQLSVIVSAIDQINSPLARDAIRQDDTVEFRMDTQFDKPETKLVTIRNRINRVDCAINSVNVEIADVKGRLSSLAERLSNPTFGQTWPAGTREQTLVLLQDRLK